SSVLSEKTFVQLSSRPAQPTLTFHFTAKDGQHHELGAGSFLTFASGDHVVLEEGFCQIITGESTKAIVLPIKECILPEEVSGPFFVYITKTDTAIPISVAQQLLLPADQRGIIAGPAVGFVDPEHVQALVAAIRKEHEH
ncbi:hypothetical protein BDY24DRAFT_416180, partial [Mrakia frigida]|uniref:uncharacterized protein n=1 Tax=Mrakia frigida TaxID=29902 RepID=UPI003FCBF6BF